MQRVAMSVSIGLFLAILLNVLAPQPALAASCGHNKSHNAFFGERLHSHVLLYEEHPRVSGKWLRVVSYTVSYPIPGDVRGTIHYIEALDQFTDGTGGCAMISSGGIGMGHASLELESQRDKGIDFVIRIFGDVRGTIGYIEVLDQFTDGADHTQSPMLKSGEIGTDHVSLELESQRGSGLDFVIRIFGNKIST